MEKQKLKALIAIGILIVIGVGGYGISSLIKNGQDPNKPAVDANGEIDSEVTEAPTPSILVDYEDHSEFCHCLLSVFCYVYYASNFF